MDLTWDDGAHQDILQALLVHLLTDVDLVELCTDADLPYLLDADGEPVAVTAVHTYRDAGVLSLDLGVVIELTDGSRFACPLSLQARPRPGGSLRPPGSH